MADSVPDGGGVGGDGGAKEKKKKRSVKKTKDTSDSGGGGGGGGEALKSDDAAEVPAVDAADNVPPAIAAEGQLSPKTSSSPPPQEVITGQQDPAAGGGDELVAAKEGNEIPADDADDLRRRAKQASPSAAALLAQEILSPVMSGLPPESDAPYVPPTAVEAGDMNALQELDERKIIELREAFNLFDLDHDGCIDANDLKATFQTLGVEMSDEFIASMLADAMDPLDFQSFVLMYGMKTIEMDPEVVLLEALTKFDKERTGQISIERMKHDLMKFGDKFSEEEAVAALQEVPIVKGTGDGFGCTGPLMFDYLTFCQRIGGFRKRRKQDPVFIH